MAMLTFALALGYGIVLAILVRALETARVEFGPFALYGGGARIVPGIGPALALMPIWTWSLRRNAGAIPLVTAPIGLTVGLGTYGLFAGGNVGANLALLGLAYGLVFVTPTALIGALFRSLFNAMRPGGIGAALVLGVGLPVGLFFPMIPMIAAGAGTGVFTAAAERARLRSDLLLIWVGLLAYLLAAAFGLPLLLR